MNQIGKSKVLVKPLGLGTNKVGGHNLFSELQDEIGREVVTAALEQGVQLLDTAFIYGKGRSEELIGEVLQQFPREQVVIADKAAHDLSSGEIVMNNHPDFLKRSVDEALLRLQTDYIDIFYIHFPDEDTNKAEAVGALAEMREAGKLKAIGVSNFSEAQIKEANQNGLVDVVEDHYSLLARQAEQNFAYFKEQQISFIPYFPLESGLLTGKYTPDMTFGKDDPRSRKVNFQGARYQAILERLAEVAQLAESHQVATLQVVLAWYMMNPALAAVIPGARTPEQVAGLVAANNLQLSPAEYQQIDKLFQGLPA